MNEHIKHIWNKASSSHVQEDTSWKTQVNFLNRFAELIIDDCARIADSNPNCKSYKDLLKAHFGDKKSGT